MSDEQIPDRLAYSIEETSRLLGVSASTVKRLIASGRLRTVRVGGHRRVPRTSLYELLETPETAQEATL